MNSNAQVAMSVDFLDSYAALPRQTQRKVSDFVLKFRSDPTSPGINYEKIVAGRDKKLCSVRIDDAYRGIVARQPETGVYILLWVAHHDDAYAWAMNKSCRVDPQTGGIYLVDLLDDLPEATVDLTPASGLFSSLDDKDLILAGVPEELLKRAKSIISKEELHSRQAEFPKRAYESLMWLSEGVPLSEVIEDAQNEALSDRENLAKALKKPETLESFVVIDDNEELRRILEEPLETWRVFLHPTQRRLVDCDYNGSARVLGGAGTGKTVVAMHRAKRLASELTGDDKVLFTTFTRNLPRDVKENLSKICTPAELERIEVTSIDDWAAGYMKSKGAGVRAVYDAKERRSMWEDAIALSGADTDFTSDFFEDEYNRVVLANDAFTLAEYAKAPRTGRGTRLDRRKRMQIWPVFQAYLDLMEERKVMDGQTLLYKCRRMVEESDSPLPYRHVIVDEAQDLSLAALRLLRAVAGPERKNDMFVVGDAHQRIYRNKTTLSKAGINIRGRSKVLRINYRTTEETRDYAFAILTGVPFDDLDAGADDSDLCRSLTHGQKPQVTRFRNANDEFEALYDEVARLIESGVEPRNICVVARTNALVDRYVDRFHDRGLRYFEIRAHRADDKSFDGIRIATMHRVKGLEFQYVFVVSANKGQIPLNAVLDPSDPVTLQESVTAEKCLLYVALTRAQKRAYVMGYGQLTDLIEGN